MAARAAMSSLTDGCSRGARLDGDVEDTVVDHAIIDGPAEPFPSRAGDCVLESPRSVFESRGAVRESVRPLRIRFNAQLARQDEAKRYAILPEDVVAAAAPERGEAGEDVEGIERRPHRKTEVQHFTLTDARGHRLHGSSWQPVPTPPVMHCGTALCVSSARSSLFNLRAGFVLFETPKSPGCGRCFYQLGTRPAAKGPGFLCASLEGSRRRSTIVRFSSLSFAAPRSRRATRAHVW